MSNTRREVIIVQLLERLAELTDPVRAGNGEGITGLLLMPHDKRCRIRTTRPPRCTCSLRSTIEIHRLLTVMRDDRHSPLLQTASGDKVSLRACWWHVTERYVNREVVTRPVLRERGRWLGLSKREEVVAQPGGWELALAYERSKKGRRQGTWLRVQVARWDPAVVQAKADRGIAWLADNWVLEVEPMLPVVEAIAA